MMGPDLRDQFQRITKRKAWPTASANIIRRAAVEPDVAPAFHAYWTEAGHRIREQFASDHELVAVLRALLPAYIGEPLQLFRGENIGRYDAGTIGVCWTTAIKTARMFGSGLNSIYTGGLLLQCTAPQAAVITGPSAHSIYLDEFEVTIDPRMVDGIEIIECYPQSSVFKTAPQS